MPKIRVRGLTAKIATAQNTNIDPGIETVDSFPDTAGKGCSWDYVVYKSGNMRKGIIHATWDPSANTTIMTDESTDDIGDTSGVTFSVDISSDNVRLRCNVNSSDWEVYVIRSIVG